MSVSVPRGGRRRTARALVCGALALTVLPATASAVVPACLRAAPWRWHLVGQPSETPVREIAQFDDQPCRMLAVTPASVFESRNGGLTWARIWQKGPADGTPVRVFTEGLGPNRAIVAFALGGGMLVSLGAETPRFTLMAGLPADAEIVAATASLPASSTGYATGKTLLVAVDGVNTPLAPPLYQSSNGGTVFVPRRMSGLWSNGSGTPAVQFRIEPTAVFLDETALTDRQHIGYEFALSKQVQDIDTTLTAGSRRIWFHLPGQELWRGDTIEGSTPPRVNDFTMVRVPGSTRAGFWAVGERGVSVADDRRNKAGGPTYYGVFGTPWGAYDLTHVRAQRGRWAVRRAVVIFGKTIFVLQPQLRPRPERGVMRGLPRGCAPTALRGSATATPTSFLVRCASNGRVYRLLSADAPPPNVPIGSPTTG